MFQLEVNKVTISIGRKSLKIEMSSTERFWQRDKIGVFERIPYLFCNAIDNCSSIVLLFY